MNVNSLFGNNFQKRFARPATATGLKPLSAPNLAHVKNSQSNHTCNPAFQGAVDNSTEGPPPPTYDPESKHKK